MKVVVIKKQDGRVAIAVPSNTSSTDEIVSNLLDGSIYRIVDSSDLPNIPGFFEALIFKNQYPHVEVDIDNAKEVWKKQIRLARAKVLEKLDVEYLKACEQENETLKASVVAKKQQLRDITKHEDLISAETIEEIKSFWPSILNN